MYCHKTSSEDDLGAYVRISPERVFCEGKYKVTRVNGVAPGLIAKLLLIDLVSSGLSRDRALSCSMLFGQSIRRIESIPLQDFSDGCTLNE
jgi:hypothetical protein